MGNVACCEVTYILVLLVENNKYITGINEIESQNTSLVRGLNGFWGLWTLYFISLNWQTTLFLSTSFSENSLKKQAWANRWIGKIKSPVLPYSETPKSPDCTSVDYFFVYVFINFAYIYTSIIFGFAIFN